MRISLDSGCIQELAVRCVAQAWYLRTVPRVAPRIQVIGSGVLLVAGAASLAAPAYVALIGAAASLTTLAIFERPARPTEGS